MRLVPRSRALHRPPFGTGPVPGGPLKHAFVRRFGTVVALLGALIAMGSESRAAATGSHDSAFAAVLMYHHVKYDKPTDDAIELGLTISPQQFKQELDYLQSAHYRTITAGDLIRHLRYGKRLPAKRVVLTFDDGYSDMFRYVFPQLVKHRMRATFFVAPGLFGKPRYLTWWQVKIMAFHGMDFQAHSMTHPDLRMVPTPQMHAEIVDSRLILQEQLHRQVHVFCYPYGGYDDQIIAEVQRAGYWGAFTTDTGWWHTRSGIYALPRVRVNRDVTIQDFARRISGSL